jgi:hypothetical protein
MSMIFTRRVAIFHTDLGNILQLVLSRTPSQACMMQCLMRVHIVPPDTGTGSCLQCRVAVKIYFSALAIGLNGIRTWDH